MESRVYVNVYCSHISTIILSNYLNNNYISILIAQMTKRHSLKKPRRTSKNMLMEEFEPIQEGFVQILIKKEHLEELQSILTISPSSKDITPSEITSLCGILADCGILNNKEN